jgi:N-acetylmuramoyl-L-alanine amidase
MTGAASLVSLASLVSFGPVAAEPGTFLVAAGQHIEVGRPVILWTDAERGFNGYADQCLEEAARQSSPCCKSRFKRFGDRPGVHTLEDLKQKVHQLVLHHDGCVNSRSCFYSMHDTPRPDGGCGLSAHFMIDADGTIYQTLDLLERAYHAEQNNGISIGVEMCNRADASRNELARLPPDYRTRPVRDVVINGHTMKAFDFRPEQYRAIIALARAIVRTFPNIHAVIPQRNGVPELDTLADPLEFQGIVGHLHVDRARQKWDPGAFDWRMFQSALNGYYLPQPIAGHARFPLDDPASIDRIASRVLESVEERSQATFPVGEGGLYHSGLSLAGVPGAPLVASAPGTIVAARFALHGTSSTSFLLIRHDVQIGGDSLAYFSLLFHVAPIESFASSGIPWLSQLEQGHDHRALSTLKLGNVALLDAHVEAGEVVARVGFVQRGSEIGPRTRFEIFTPGEIPPAPLARSFRTADGTHDGPWMRRGYVLDLLATAGVKRLDAGALAGFFRDDDNLDGRQALRRLAVRHPHEWGDRIDETSFTGSPELADLDPGARKRLYDESIRPYVFWTDGLSEHAHLPKDQVVYSYNPIAFLAALAAAHGGGYLKWPAADIADRDAPPVVQPKDALEIMGRSPALAPPMDPPTFGPLVRAVVEPRRVRDIPLISLPGLEEGTSPDRKPGRHEEP